MVTRSARAAAGPRTTPILLLILAPFATGFLAAHPTAEPAALPGDAAGPRPARRARCSWLIPVHQARPLSCCSPSTSSVAGALAASRPAPASEWPSPSARRTNRYERIAILTDVTRCIGCEDCVDACRHANADRRGRRRLSLAGRSDGLDPRGGRPSQPPGGRYVRVSSAATAWSRPARPPARWARSEAHRRAGGLRRRQLHGLPLLHAGLPVPHVPLRVGLGDAPRPEVRPLPRPPAPRRLTAGLHRRPVRPGHDLRRARGAARRGAPSDRGQPRPLHPPCLGRARGRRHLGALHLRRRPLRPRLARGLPDHAPCPSSPPASWHGARHLPRRGRGDGRDPLGHRRGTAGRRGGRRGHGGAACATDEDEGEP